MLGVTRPEGGDWAPVGDLSWSHNLPDGRITARLSRSVSTTNDDEEALTTLVALGYDHRINAVSDLGFKLSYAAIDQTGTDPSVSRASLSATYSRALTADWNMSFGLAYQLRDQAGAGQASSETVFLGLSRRFDWRP
jgi:hypothetical protein